MTGMRRVRYTGQRDRNVSRLSRINSAKSLDSPVTRGRLGNGRVSGFDNSRLRLSLSTSAKMVCQPLGLVIF